MIFKVKMCELLLSLFETRIAEFLFSLNMKRVSDLEILSPKTFLAVYIFLTEVPKNFIVFVNRHKNEMTL